MSDSELAGIVNGHVVDDHLLRGGDVSLNGITTLAQLGVTRIICCKNYKDDSRQDIEAERQQAGAVSIDWVYAPLDSSGIFSYDDGSRVQAILDSIAGTAKAFVHCHHGSDRTGVVVACYRITKGWSLDRALDEMKHYGNSWIHFGMREFVREYYQARLNL